MWIGSGQKKNMLNFGKDLGHILDTKKHPGYSEISHGGGLYSYGCFLVFYRFEFINRLVPQIPQFLPNFFWVCIPKRVQPIIRENSTAVYSFSFVAHEKHSDIAKYSKEQHQHYLWHTKSTQT